MTARKRVAILISGRGSNMASLVAAAAAPDYPATVALVLSNRPDAAGLDLARQAGIATVALDHRRFPGRDAFDAAMDAELARHDIEMVALAGFMRILGDAFATRWSGRMLNIHPSLLPAFKGLHPHRQALEAGVRVHGCTVHFVVPELDSGPIVAQALVPVRPEDDEATLAARVLGQEHRLYPRGLGLVASGGVRLEGGRAVVADGAETLLGLA